MVKDVAFKKYL